MKLLCEMIYLSVRYRRYNSNYKNKVLDYVYIYLLVLRAVICISVLLKCCNKNHYYLTNIIHLYHKTRWLIMSIRNLKFLGFL